MALLPVNGLTDGHHKLIRWRLVTHCAIDGFSQLVLFIKCSDNNRATTVYNLFFNLLVNMDYLLEFVVTRVVRTFWLPAIC